MQMVPYFKSLFFCKSLLYSHCRILIIVISATTCFGQGKAVTKKGTQSANEKDYLIPKMVFVKRGQFTMGCNTNDRQEEQPEHQVNLNSFWIGKYEVTVGEFRKFIKSRTYVTDAEKDGYSNVWDGENRNYDKPGVTWECNVLGNKHINEENHPVTHISRNDAIAYCNWLSKRTGKQFRLLTEAEWEYAAKGGTRHDKYTYSGGNDMYKVGWYAFNSNAATHPVGKKTPNGLGIHDMSGNVWEWCSDWYGPYGPATQTNPKGPDTGSNGIVRGGGWRYKPMRTNCTARRDMAIRFNAAGTGFRLASSEDKL